MNAPDIERIVADFRSWWTELPPADADRILQTPAAAPVLDLTAVVQQFVALRQEVNLQTRASRQVLEQNGQTLEKFAETLESLQQAPTPDEPDRAETVLRPVLKSLVDVRDALALADRHVRKIPVGEAERTALEPMPLPPEESGRPSFPPPIVVPLPPLARWFGLESRIREATAPLKEWIDQQPPGAGLSPTQRGELQAWHNRQVAVVARVLEQSEQLRQALDSIRTGYAMSLQRLERTLEQLGLERIDCLGIPFDPETMEAVEIVRDPTREKSEVIEELRPGYRWLDKLFRCAHVRVARPA